MKNPNPLSIKEQELIIRGNDKTAQISYEMHPDDFDIRTAIDVCENCGRILNMKMKNIVVGQNIVVTNWERK